MATERRDRNEIPFVFPGPLTHRAPVLLLSSQRIDSVPFICVNLADRGREASFAKQARLLARCPSVFPDFSTIH